MAGKAAWALSRCLTTENADYFMLVSEWAWLRLLLLFKLIMAKSGVGSSFELELGQKWRHGALRHVSCMVTSIIVFLFGLIYMISVWPWIFAVCMRLHFLYIPLSV